MGNQADLFGGKPLPQFNVAPLNDMGTYDSVDLNHFEVKQFTGFGQCRVSKAKAIKGLDKKFVKARYAKDLVTGIGEIEKDSIRRCVLSGAFVYSDFIKMFIEENQWHVNSMSICTLSMNPGCVDNLAYLVNEGWVDELNLIIGARWYNDEYHNTVKYMYSELDIDNRVQIAIASSHMKDCIFEIEAGDDGESGYINMEGSANLRTSQCNEKLLITEDKEAYLWNKSVMDNIISEYKTINKDVQYEDKAKALRNKPLWKATIS